MTKVSIGLLTAFNHETQEWNLYKGRLEQWFLANEIDGETDKSGAKRRAILLSSLAETTYRLATTLALPKEIGTLSYSEVTTLLDGHFKIKTCGFAERHNFFSATQMPDESLSVWAARVRGLSMHCGFAAGSLEETLRDRFVLGMAGGAERERLFREPLEGLTVEKALQLAESIRCAREGAQQTAGRAAPVPGIAAAQLIDVHKMAARAPAGAARSPRYSRDTVSGGANTVQDPKFKVQCSVCGYFGHESQKCKFRNSSCRKCGSKGHLVKVCNSSKGKANQCFLQCCSDDDDGKRLIFNIRSHQGEPMQESVVVDNICLTFEIDTGSAVTAISDIMYAKYFSDYPLTESNKILRSYNGTFINCLGTTKLPFCYKKNKQDLEVFVVKNGGPPLLGRDFIAKYNLQICSVQNCKIETDVVTLLEKNSYLFADKLGCCQGVEVKLLLKLDAIPVFHKARPVPFALRQKLEQELDRLQTLGIIEPVTFSDYASPIVPVLKKDGSIRLCADYSATLNKQLIIEKYPLPRIDELFARLHGGKQFTKLDLSGAYNQLKLDPSSQVLTCINTHKGLYKYTRLVFGLSSAPAIFQRTLERMLAGVDGVLQFLDDILITGNSREEHLARLREVFKRLGEAGLILKKDKCSFFQDSVSYLGFVIDKQGLHKSPEKVQAIVNAEPPRNVTELKSFLGLVNYYRNFINNASTILHPLHKLLQKKEKWHWSKEQDDAFQSIKESLSSDNTLAHFDPEARIILTVDASPFGLAAILSQQDKSGAERPVSYMSRSLNSAERNYSQIQKEATAIIFGVRKFHQFLYGRPKPFILRTDHKPLLSIFQPGKGIPEVSANRLQRYALFLSAYNYLIEYVSSAHNSADFLSRAMPPHSLTAHSDSGPLAACDSDLATYVHFVVETGSAPALLRDVRRATEADPLLSQIVKHLNNGWPTGKISKEIKPYFNCRTELSLENGCVMRGFKLVVPSALIDPVLTELHRGHLGIVKMKAEARARFWWPGLGAALERAAATCAVCAQLRPAPRRAPLTPWPFPPEPWYRVHLDFLGPLNNKTFLVAVDAYSKWVEVFDVSSGYGTKVVINILCDLMARFGLIHTLCTDNGTSFVSGDFEKFCLVNGITHVTSPTYHPASNGQAESYVKIVKKGLKSIILSGTQNKDLGLKLKEFLFYYRNSKHSTTNRSPAEILFGRNLRCRLDLLMPPPAASDTALSDTVNKNQCSQVKHHRGSRNIDFEIDDLVLVKMYNGQNTSWTKGTIKKKLGRSAYLVALDTSHRTIKRHKNQLRELRGEGECDNRVKNDSAKSEHDRNTRFEAPSTESTSQDQPPPLVILTEGSPGPSPIDLPETRSLDTEDSAATSEPETWADCQEPDALATTALPADPRDITQSSTAAALAEAARETPMDTEPSARPKRPRKPIDYKKYF